MLWRTEEILLLYSGTLALHELADKLVVISLMLYGYLTGSYVRDKDGMGFFHFWGKECRHSVFTFRAGYSRWHFSQRTFKPVRRMENQNSIW